MHAHVLVQNWWALALRGVFAIIFGLLSLIWPGLSLAALVLLFGAYALVDGIFALIAALRRAEAHMRWAPFAWEGVFGIAAGGGDVFLASDNGPGTPILHRGMGSTDRHLQNRSRDPAPQRDYRRMGVRTQRGSVRHLRHRVDRFPRRRCPSSHLAHRRVRHPLRPIITGARAASSKTRDSCVVTRLMAERGRGLLSTCENSYAAPSAFP